MTPVRASCRLIVPVLLAALAGPAWAQQHAPAAPEVPDRQAQWPAWEQLSPAQLESAGIPEDLVRISVGLEDLDDILWDLDQALDAATEEPTTEALSADACTIGANA